MYHMDMRHLISLILYYLGDLTSNTTMLWFNGLGYRFYQKVMLLSCDLDSEGKVWKYVKPNKTKIKKRKKKKS